jgi:protein ImuB
VLWIALYLPELSLEVANRAQPGAGSSTTGRAQQDPRASFSTGNLIVDLPLAVSDGPDNRPFVLAANAPARAAGVHPGMSVAAASALASGLITLPRSRAREQHALQQIAGWSAQFTPTVVLEHCGVLLEVAASLTLFGGLARLLGQLRRGLAALGYRVVLGVAPTALAAWLLARAGREQTGVRACVEPRELPARLGELPLALFDWPRATHEALSALGLRRVREALALPRDGFRRRFGAQPLADLERALGRVPDPRVCYALPEQFASRLDLLCEVNDTALLEVPIARLLTELEGFLRARGAGALQLEFELEHGRSQPPTRLAIGALAAERASARWSRLVRERLQRLELRAAVSALALRVDTLHGFGERSETFLPDAARRAQSWRELSERLASRLDAGSMFVLELRDDHRPEQAWQRADAALLPGQGRRAATPPTPAPPPGSAPPVRPLLLLERPRVLVCAEARPQYQGPLELISGPERIESGWWDGRAVARDYYIARNRAGEMCWIYREPAAPSRWFLHGLFG